MTPSLNGRLGARFVALHERLSGSAWLAWGLLAVAAAVIAVGALQFRFSTQMTDVMPAGAERDRMVSVLENFKLTTMLLVHIEDPRDPPDPDALVALQDRIAGELEDSGLFKQVVYRVPSDEQQRVYEAIFPRRFYLLPADEAAARTTAEGIGGGLDRTLARLLSLEASFTEPLLRRDPLGFGEAVMQRALTGQQQFDVQLYHGHLLTGDRAHALVIAEPLGTGMDVATLEQTLSLAGATVDDALGDPAFAGLHAELAGGPVYSMASATIIRQDVQIAMGATAVGILLIFLVFFRNLRVLLFAYLPPALGVGAGLAALGYAFGGAHGISLGFGAAMLGITVDYTIHLFTRVLQAEATMSRVEAVRRTVAEVTPSLAVGCLTTLIGFGTLMISDTKALRDMSLMAVGGIAAAFVLCTTLMPVAYRTLGGRARRGAASAGNRAAGLGRLLAGLGGHIDRRPWPFLAGWGVLTVAVGAAALGIRFDGDIRNLDYQPPDVRAIDERFQDAFGAGMAGSMAVVERPSLEEALQANERLEQLLAGGVEQGLLAAYSSSAAILPSERSQRARLEAMIAGGVEPLLAEVDRAAVERGFVAGYFAPFGDDLRAVADGSVAPLALSDLDGTSIGSLLQRRVGVRDGAVQILTLVETAGVASGEGERRALDAGVFPNALIEQIERELPGTLIVSFPDLAARLMHRIKRDLVRLGGVCLALLSLVLLVYYRRPTSVALALLPCLCGFVYGAGLLALIDVPLNMINVCGMAITLGVSIDYGVFVVDRLGHADTGGRAADVLGSAGTGVLMSSLTTVFGLGTMAVARNPSMSSMGLVVIFGVIGGLLTALIGVPALSRGLRRPAR